MEFSEAKLDEIMQAAMADFDQSHRYDGVVSDAGSPIEVYLRTALFWRGLRCGRNVIWLPPADLATLKAMSKADGSGIAACSQMTVGSYRVDIGIAVATSSSNGAVVIGVECDGHEFHEKTKDQASRDKRRDREIVAHGVRMLRFTGAEIWAGAYGCASQVFDIIDDVLITDLYERFKMGEAPVRNSAGADA